MKTQTVFASLGVILVATIWAIREPAPGPGMIVALDNAVTGYRIDMLRATTHGGKEFLGGKIYIAPTYSPIGFLGGRVQGVAPDNEDLPSWVEFEWQQWEYPHAEKPNDPEAEKKWAERIHELRRTLPHKVLRIPVRSRVPQDVVDEAIASSIAAPRGKLPNKQIWLYFVWHPNGIWFRWSLKQGSDVLRSGGDALPGRTQAVTTERP